MSIVKHLTFPQSNTSLVLIGGFRVSKADKSTMNDLNQVVCQRSLAY